MVVGVVSDSHGKADRLRAALAKFTARGVQAVVHCGDLGSVECLEVLAAAGVPAYAVIGNMDRHVEQLEAAAGRCGVIISRKFVEVPLDPGKMLAATHGDDRKLLEQLIGSGRYACVCRGHTHRPACRQQGGVLVVNPGALRRPAGSSKAMAAIIDTLSGSVEHIRL